MKKLHYLTENIYDATEDKSIFRLEPTEHIKLYKSQNTSYFTRLYKVTSQKHLGSCYIESEKLYPHQLAEGWNLVEMFNAVRQMVLNQMAIKELKRNEATND